MAQRGRGTLEVRPSVNPFMQTMSTDYGAKASKIDWRTQGFDPTDVKTAPKVYESDGNFAFLYSRESDTIGSRLEKPKHSLAFEPKTKGEMLREKRDRLRELAASVKVEEPVYTTEELVERKNADIERTLKSWKQPTKVEDPRYTTSNNELGIKRPTIATYVAERHFKTQAFSNKQKTKT